MQRQLALALAAAVLTACGNVARPTGPDASLAAPVLDSPPQPEYLMIPLGHLGDGTQGWGADINSRNQVVGAASTTADPAGPRHAFLWENGVMQDLGTLGGANSVATEINASGQVVGWAETAEGAVHAFFWEAGTMHDLGPVAVRFWQLRRYDVAHINDQGQVVGNRPEGGAFLWQAGVTQALPLDNGTGINNRGQVVGWVTTTDTNGTVTRRGVLWEEHAGVTDLGMVVVGRFTRPATAISNSGWVAGVSLARHEVLPGFFLSGHWPFRWKDGVLEDLGTPKVNEIQYEAFAVTDQGQVLVQIPGTHDSYFWDGSVWRSVSASRPLGDMNRQAVITGRHAGIGAFVWQDGVLLDLEAGESASDGIGINDANVVTGTSKEQVAVIWVPVPRVVAGVP